MSGAGTIHFISGLLVAGYAVAALFFLRFWRAARDSLFAWFAAAFALLALQRVALVSAASLPFEIHWYYLLRLLAFVFIIIGIAGKNARD